ncbi:hypothetical protein Trihar35433_929 [Trichoderma harzianum]|nr:hypothetical protein Trihar35433_929 [Trichoderma harzianum]
MTKRDLGLENTENDVSSPGKRWKKDVDNVQTPLRKLKPDDYTVGWICAITVEYVAAQEFLDEEHEGPEDVSLHDNNNYTLGSIGEHKVVIATLPFGEYGIASAAAVARDMMHSFPNIRIGLMVGIGGGAPSEHHDIRLGDIVVSAPKNGHGGLLQYDFGKNIQDQEFLATGFLNQPPIALRTALAGLQAQYERKGHRIEQAVDSVLEKNKRLRRQYKRPDQSSDRLYATGIVHPNTKESCVLTCDESELIARPERDEDEDDPAIHYGLIASANQLMKNAVLRDKLAAENNVLCFEMEAAGLMNHFPCLVIRGICDYSDSHKNKEWQGYAAMVAAAYAKDLLYRIAPKSVTAEKRIIDVLSDVQEAVHGVEKEVHKLVHKQHSQEQRAILDWLTLVDYAPQHNDFISRQQGGTGQWFLESTQYKTWLDTKGQTLFCPGIPGAGKTIITAIVVNHLFTHFRGDADIGIAYIYCNFRQQTEQTAIRLLTNLLKQLAQGQSHLSKDIKDLFGRHQESRTQPSLGEVTAALQDITKKYSRSFIVIDALDECQELGQLGLLDEVFNLQTKTGVNILATSRFSETIKKRFDGCPTVEISATDGDILTYLNGQISLRRSNMINGDLQCKISTQLTKASGGMFLLAMFHIKEIMEQPTIGDIEDVLQKLGSGMEGLNELYKQAIKRINDHPEVTKRLAKRILIWITRAQRPLSIVEIRHALAVRENMLKFDLKYMPDMEFLTSVCAGLVTIDESSEIIRLVHYTTQEFLQQTHEEWFPQGELYMTKVCATYLSFDTFDNGPCQTGDELKERLNSNPLYHYAAHNWGNHARAAATISQQVIDLLECKAKMEAASQILMAVRPLKSSDLLSRFIERIPRELTRLHLAAYFGVETAVGHFLRKGDNPDLKDTYGRTPLSWAAENGHAAVVALLLKTGQVDAGSEDKWNQTPLLYASANNYEGTVELLLENGVNVDSKNIHIDADAKIIGAYSGRTPLLYASANGYVAIVKLLLEKGASIDLRDMDGKTALAFAVEGGHEKTAQLLLDNGADVNIRDNNDRTPLSWAVSKRHEALFQLLLNRGTTIQPDDHYLTKSSWAIQQLRRGYHLEGDDAYTQTPLVRAIKENQIIAAELLFDRGADPNLRGSDQRTPLSWAVELGHSAIVQLLLDKGADPNVKDSTRRTPLSVAAEKGYTDIVQLLLDKGADPNVEDFNKRTPLSVAAERGHASIFQLLLEKGVDPNLEGPDKRTPLSLAVEMGRVAIVQLLLDKGVEISYEDMDVSSLLLNSAEKGCIDIIQHILNKDAQCETSDLIMLDSLFQAVEMGHIAIVQLLLDRGADISHEATDVSLFPSNAFTERSMVIIQQILDNDVQLGASAVVVPALLLLAVEMGHTAIVELLLDRAAEIGLRNRQLWVPLLSGAIEVATEFNHIVIVQLLIEHGHYI